MTDRERQMIEMYIPHPRDPSLEPGQYYFKQATARGEIIVKVFPLDVLPRHEGTEYGLYQQRGAQLVWLDGCGLGDRNRGVRMGYLYDNRQDCIDGTHWWNDDWEALRELERESSDTD